MMTTANVELKKQKQTIENVNEKYDQIQQERNHEKKQEIPEQKTFIENDINTYENSLSLYEKIEQERKTEQENLDKNNNNKKNPPQQNQCRCCSHGAPHVQLP